MRGIPSACSMRLTYRRITPAHAGNTSINRLRREVSKDHPRACGEYPGDTFNLSCSLGSPPRMRGILPIKYAKPLRSGITPAHAGNTERSGPESGADGDHPRACGEYGALRKHPGRNVGSPPRMRGIPAPAVPAAWPAGITPAHAGNTSSIPRQSAWPGDHPRACGEY